MKNPQPKMVLRLAFLCPLLAGGAASVSAPALAADETCGQGNAQVRLLDPEPSIAGRLHLEVTGARLRRYSVAADTGPGPVTTPRGTFCLDLGPDLVLLADGIRHGDRRLGIDGSDILELRIPNRPSIAGRTFYVQALVDDPQAPNELAISNRIDVTVLDAIVEDFLTTERKDPASSAIWTGDGRVVGIVSTTPRTVQYTPTDTGFNLPQPLVSGTDLNTVGCRFMMLFNPTLLGIGQGESILGMSWSPRSNFTFFSGYLDMVVRLGHFANDPNPSLSTTFNNNYLNGPDGMQEVYRGHYVVNNSAASPWVPWPTFTSSFPYDSSHSLVFEVDLPRGGTSFQLFHNNSTSSTPHTRNFADGGAEVATNRFENTTYWTSLTVIRDRAIAQSKWIDAGIENPDWSEPTWKTPSLPEGTEVRLQVEGAHDGDHDGYPDLQSLTGWRTNIDDLDYRRMLRFRLVLHGNTTTGAVPTARRVVIPFR